MRTRTYRLALTAVLTALSLVAFVLENLLPALPLPGAKIGLANVFSLFALVALGWQYALVVVVVRVTLGCLITGNVGALLYSLSAGIAAMAVGIVLGRLMPRVSVVAVAVAMAVTHNLVQTLVYCAVVANSGMLAYLPYLCLFGILSGAVVGVIVLAVCRALPSTLWHSVRTVAPSDVPLEPPDESDQNEE